MRQQVGSLASRASPLLLAFAREAASVPGPSPVAFHSCPRLHQSGAASPEPSLIPFPREGPGVSYALNWALAAAGVTPAGTVSRNLKPAQLKTLVKASPVKPSSGSKLLFQGSQGDTALTPSVFKRVLKEVTSHLSKLPTLFVHDGAVGSSSSCDARTRVIAESPAAAAALAGILEPTPTRTLGASSFPITLYAVPSYKNDSLGVGGFVAVDFSSSLIIAAGAAVGDSNALKAALSAVSVGPILKRGAVSLPGRFVTGGDSSPFLLLAPKAAGDSVLAGSSMWGEPGFIWGPAGVARQFSIGPGAPALYHPPSAFVLLTSDSTSALPPRTPLTPEKAAFFLLAGYDGAGFNPACARPPSGLGSADPLALAQTLAALISSTSTPTYLVNTHGQEDVGGLVTKVASAKIAGDSPVNGDAVVALTEKLTDFVRARFPSAPAEYAP